MRTSWLRPEITKAPVTEVSYADEGVGGAVVELWSQDDS
jgi:hypothetical protein